MIRKFNVLQNTYGKMSIYEGQPLMRKGETIEVEVLKNNIHVYNNWRFHPSWFDMWLTVGYLEEILPDEKPISSEENTNIEEDIYSKKYNIYEILTLIPNLPKDTKFKCSLNYNESWYPCVTEKTLVDELEGNDSIDEYYELKDILEATYTIVKPVEIEEVKEKWVEIKNSRELCHSIVKDNTIKIMDEKFTEEDDGHVWKIENYGTIIFKPPFTKDVIDKLYDYKHMPRYKIEYLEEN